MPNHTNSLKQIDKELQPLVKEEYANKCVQQSKEIEKYAYDRNEEKEEIFESRVRTLPLCFASFKFLKKNVNNVSDKKPSRYVLVPGFDHVLCPYYIPLTSNYMPVSPFLTSF